MDIENMSDEAKKARETLERFMDLNLGGADPDITYERDHFLGEVNKRLSGDKFAFCLDQTLFTYFRKVMAGKDPKVIDQFKQDLDPVLDEIIGRYGTIPTIFESGLANWGMVKEEEPRMCGHFRLDGYSNDVLMREGPPSLGILQPVEEEEYKIGLDLYKKILLVTAEGQARAVLDEYGNVGDRVFENMRLAESLNDLEGRIAVLGKAEIPLSRLDFHGDMELVRDLMVRNPNWWPKWKDAERGELQF
jgi:hypothetical protein